jgi:hypothetical protein
MSEKELGEQEREDEPERIYESECTPNEPAATARESMFRVDSG